MQFRFRRVQKQPPLDQIVTLPAARCLLVSVLIPVPPAIAPPLAASFPALLALPAFAWHVCEWVWRRRQFTIDRRLWLRLRRGFAALEILARRGKFPLLGADVFRFPTGRWFDSLPDIPPPRPVQAGVFRLLTTTANHGRLAAFGNDGGRGNNR